MLTDPSSFLEVVSTPSKCFYVPSTIHDLVALKNVKI